MSVLSFVLSHYLAIGLLAFASYLFGRRLLSKIRFSSIWEEISFSMALGLGVIAYLVFFLGISKLLYLSVLLVMFLVGALGCYPVWRTWPRRLTTLWAQLRVVKKSHIVLALVIFALSLPVWLLPLYPPTAWDSTSYHLAAAKIYTQTHYVGLTPYLRFPVFPQINQMLFTLMLLFYDDVTAQLTQFLMMVLVALALYAWGRRVLSPRAGLWAAALWLANPLVLWLGASAYTDIGLTLFITMSAYGFITWLQTRQQGWLVMAAVLCGFAAGSKYSALFFLGLFGIITIYFALRERKFSYPIVFGIIAALVASPWYIRNFYYTGNPVWPFFGQIFGYGFWNPQDLQGALHDLLYAHSIGRNLVSLLFLPWNLTFNPNLFHIEAPLSPIYFFALPLLLLGIMNKTIRVLLGFSLAYTLFWFFSAQIPRYLVLVFPMLSLATAAALEHFLLWLPFLRKWTSHVFVTVLGFALLISPGWLYAVHKVNQQGPVPVTQEQRDNYLAQRLPSYGAYKFLNELKGRDYTLYALYDENMAYFADGVFMGDHFGVARFSDLLAPPVDGRVLYDRLRRLGADHLLVNLFRIPIRFPLPGDDWFKEHFVVLFAGAHVLLFELTEVPVRLMESPELLRNPGFEEIDGNLPAGWGVAGSPMLDGIRSRTGKLAVMSLGTANVFFQVVPIKEGGLYVLRQFVRADDEGHEGQKVRLQVNWLDREKMFLSTSIRVVEVPPEWEQHEMWVTAPSGAAHAVVYASPHEDSVVWFDDLSFVRVFYAD